MVSYKDILVAKAKQQDLLRDAARQQQLRHIQPKNRPPWAQMKYQLGAMLMNLGKRLSMLPEN